MDLIDEILADWATQRPDINCGGKAVVCRILRNFSHALAALEKALKPLGISPNDFSVLVTIRRKGPKAEITVKQVMEEVLVTSGGMTNLLNKLIELNLIKKRKGTKKEDGRSAFVKLTPKGLDLIDRAMEVQAACERKLTQTLSNTEKRQLADLLKKMLQEEDVYVANQ
jgi:DNA-binding MarR family transcriptional regulator